MDVWQYISAEDMEVPSVYLAHEREVVERAGTYLAKSKFITLDEDEEYETQTVRFGTIGDMTCTGAFKSDASTVPQVIEEVASARITERGNRTDDKRAEAAMEERKKLGYF